MKGVHLTSSSPSRDEDSFCKTAMSRREDIVSCIDVTIAAPGIAVARPVIAADRKVFLTPMEDGLRVAGTVEFGGLERVPNHAVVQMRSRRRMV